MAVPIWCSKAPLNLTTNLESLKFSISVSLPNPNFSSSLNRSSSSSSSSSRLILCRAANSRTGPVNNKQRSSSSSSSTTGNSNKKKKKKTTKNKSTAPSDSDDPDSLDFADFEIMRDFGPDGPEFSTSNLDYVPTNPMPLPGPPAGFLVGDDGKVLLTSANRLVTIVDPSNNLPLECVVRRVFKSSEREECMLLCPVDTPVQILKSTNIDGWSAISDEEVESILPAAAYALAKIHMHLVYSGFCYTARGGFCYSEEDIFDFHTDDGRDVDGLPSEGVEITYFNLEGAQYMIYTPSDPLLFVAVKDEDGMLRIADDDLLEDPAIIDAIDEETEFNALVEEEAALHESMMGES